MIGKRTKIKMMPFDEYNTKYPGHDSRKEHMIFNIYPDSFEIALEIMDKTKADTLIIRTEE